MADTVRTRASILALFADNTTGDISPQDLRDFVLSTMGVAAQIYQSAGSAGMSVGTSFLQIAFGYNGPDENAIADQANDRIQIGASGDGVYLVLGSFSFDGSASTKFTIQASKNGTENASICCEADVNATPDLVSASFTGLMTLAAGDYVTAEVKADGAAKTFTLREGSLTVVRIY